MNVPEDIRKLVDAYVDAPMSPDPDSPYMRNLDALVKACQERGLDHHVMMRAVLDERVGRK